MGEQRGVGDFVAEDRFLRRTDRKGYIKERDGRFVVVWEAFKPRPNERDLSFTFQALQLQSEEALRQFQQDKELPESGDLPGICRLSYANLNDQSLPPRFKEDPDDTVYGKLHHVTDLPSQPQMESLAAMASQNNDFGLPFPLIKRRKRVNFKDAASNSET